MKIGQFLVVDQPNRGRFDETVSLDEVIYFEPGSVVPIIVPGTGCPGLAKIKSCSMKEYGTIVSFKFVQDQNKYCEAYYHLYIISTGNNGGAMGSKVDSDTKRTGMSAAARMMMGVDRSAREIGRDQMRHRDDDDDDDDTEDLWSMMKRSNPDDPMFR